MTAARFLISGAVQGVGFRMFVSRHAESLGLDGYVRNLDDGRVEVQAHGSDDALDALGARLRAGPRAARVDHVERMDQPADAGATRDRSGFRVT